MQGGFGKRAGSPFLSVMFRPVPEVVSPSKQKIKAYCNQMGFDLALMVIIYKRGFGIKISELKNQGCVCGYVKFHARQGL